MIREIYESDLLFPSDGQNSTNFVRARAWGNRYSQTLAAGVSVDKSVRFELDDLLHLPFTPGI